MPLDFADGQLVGYILSGTLTFIGAISFFIGPKLEEQTTSSGKIEEKIKKEEIKSDWGGRLTKGLEASRSQIWGKLFGILGGGNHLSSDQEEQIEELLYTADIGPSMVEEIITFLKENSSDESMQDQLYSRLFEKLNRVQGQRKLLEGNGQETETVMIVGVNGAGKTTTLGKLATKLSGEGKKVIVGACDTFRAAAVDQLEVWCQRAGAEMVRAKEGADPSGVAYDTLAKAQKEKADICLIDTAGRLHTAGNLMDELNKTKRVLGKVNESAPDHIWLVIDAVTGQNALRQAVEFNKTLNLTGIVLTKCDGSSKAGAALGIVDQLQVPITYIGVGESVEDLEVFSTKEYLKALIYGSSEKLTESKSLHTVNL